MPIFGCPSIFSKLCFYGCCQFIFGQNTITMYVMLHINEILDIQLCNSKKARISIILKIRFLAYLPSYTLFYVCYKLIWLYFIFSVFLFVIVYMTFSQYSRDFYLLRSRNNVLEIDWELLLRNANDPRFQMEEFGGGGWV